MTTGENQASSLLGDNVVSGSKEDLNSNLSVPGYLVDENSLNDAKGKQSSENILNNINIRKAIFYAIDREKIAKELLGDYGQVQNSLFCINSNYYYPAWDKYSFNQNLAKEYLKKAGYSLEIPLYLTIGANTDSIARQKIQEIIKENLSQVGIQLQIENKESKEWFTDSLKNGNFELGLWSISIKDLNFILNYFSSNKLPSLETDKNKNCNNFYWYTNSDVDFLLEKIQGDILPSERKDLINKLQDYLSEDVFFLPLYSRVYAIAFNKKIKNIDIDYIDGNYFKNIENMDIELPDEGLDEKNLYNKENNNKNSTASKSLIVGIQREPYSFNPFIADSAERDLILKLITKGLWSKNDIDNYEPFLVDSILLGSEVNSTNEKLKVGLKLTVKLRGGIYWQDGNPIFAEDIVNTIKAIKESNLSNSNGNFNGIDYNIINSIEAIDQAKLQVTFNQYKYNWKDLFDFIIPSNLLKDSQIEELFSDNIFNCGPYILKEWVSGEYLLLERNPYYFGQNPKIDRIKFIFNSDINELIRFLKDGDIDILSIPADISLFEEIKKNKDLDLKVIPGPLWEHLAICLK